MGFILCNALFFWIIPFFFFFFLAVDNYCVNFCAILTPAGGLLIFLLFLTWCFYASLIIVNYSGIFYFCQYLHIGAGILSFEGDVF